MHIQMRHQIFFDPIVQPATGPATARYAMLIIRNKQGPQKFLIEKTSQASFTNPLQFVSLIFDIFSMAILWVVKFQSEGYKIRQILAQFTSSMEIIVFSKCQVKKIFQTHFFIK